MQGPVNSFSVKVDLTYKDGNFLLIQWEEPEKMKRRNSSEDNPPLFNPIGKHK